MRVPRKAATLALLAIAGLSLLIFPPAAADAGRPVATVVRARLARSLAFTDASHLHLAHKGSEEITEEGRAAGTIPGKVIAHLIVGPIVEATFTIYTSAGTISGEGSGTPKGRPEEPSFAGKMTISRGTGRYKHVRGHGGFYGTLNRKTYAMVVQTTGTISY